jgi:hypothetical protein
MHNTGACGVHMHNTGVCGVCSIEKLQRNFILFEGHPFAMHF